MALPELDTEYGVVNSYVICTECKVGKLYAQGSLIDTADFSNEHAAHGLVATTEADFLERYVADGFVDVDRPGLKPIVTKFSPAIGTLKSTSAPPFGFPGSGSDGVGAQRRAMMGGFRPRIISEFDEQRERVSLRPSWDETFLDVARVLARRGTCSRKAVGAVLVKDTRVIATGYNGAPAGLPHCNHQAQPAMDGQNYITVGSDMENGHCAVAEHAERNALIYSGRESRGGTMYVTVAPCLTCLRMMITAGVVRVVYGEEYRPDRRVEELCAQAGIEITHFKRPDPISDPISGVK